MFEKLSISYDFSISFLVISARMPMDFSKECSCLVSRFMLYTINKFTSNAIKYCNFKVKCVTAYARQGVKL